MLKNVHIDVGECFEGVELVVAFDFDEVYFVYVAFVCSQELKLMLKILIKIGLV
jgi:hypothetical protein